ncbi:hypothetical protein ABZW96_37380 [Nocardia sp. NPDC004168]|uniref:WXG100-like domain-containing protein n=1 Tax=Nocardia sp. NPDC004168 TaxID=3154452 RepID=UPI0033BA0A3F
MAIELPDEVISFLNFLGFGYPDVNEDDIRALGRHILDFAVNVQNSHQAATGVVADMGSVYSGESYEALVAAWGRMSKSHMAHLDSACKTVAAALDIAADVVTAVKIAVLAELAALAISYGVALATPGGAILALAVRDMTRRVLNGMGDYLTTYLIEEVDVKAIGVLKDVIDRMIKNAVRGALISPESPGKSTALTLYIEPDEVLRRAELLDTHADDILKHAAAFADSVANLTFTTRSGSYVDSDLELSPQWGNTSAHAESPHAELDSVTYPASSLTGPPVPVDNQTSDGPGVETDRHHIMAAESDVRRSSADGVMETPRVESTDSAHLYRENSVGADGLSAAQVGITSSDDSSARRGETSDTYATNDAAASANTADRHASERILNATEAQISNSNAVQPTETLPEATSISAIGTSVHQILSSSLGSPEVLSDPYSPGQPGSGSAAAGSPWARSAKPRTRQEPAVAQRSRTSNVENRVGRKPGRTPWSKSTRKPDNRKPDAVETVASSTSKPATIEPADGAIARKQKNRAGTVDGESDLALTDSGSTEPSRKTAIFPPIHHP